MKAIGLTLLLAAVATALFAISSNASTAFPLTLKGTVQGVEIREDKSNSRYSLTSVFIQFSFRLTNTGTKPIILLQRGPECNEVVVAKKPDDLDVRFGRFLAYSSASSSVTSSPELKRLRASLNQPFPPLEETRTLYTGDTFDFDGMIKLSLPKEPVMYVSYPTKSESLRRLRQLSPVLLRVRCEPWPLNLEGIGEDPEQLKFGTELQNKWRDYGVLWLNDIYSEPITLDLSAYSKN